MLDNYEIYPYKGVGNLSFSFTCEEVKRYLGEPSYFSQGPDDMVFAYQDIGLNIVFTKPGGSWIISTLEFEKGFYTIWGHQVIDQNLQHIKALLKEKVGESFVEDKSQQGHYIFCENLGLCFEFENETVSVVYIDNPQIG